MQTHDTPVAGCLQIPSLDLVLLLSLPGVEPCLSDTRFQHDDYVSYNLSAVVGSLPSINLPKPNARSIRLAREPQCPYLSVAPPRR